MNKDLLNILSNSNKDIDNQQLMDYLSGKLSDEQMHEIERSMADSALAGSPPPLPSRMRRTADSTLEIGARRSWPM